MSERHPRVLAIDAGGTMTDTFIVDASGQFIVGKAQTTPEDEAVGFMRSAEDALDYWNLEPSFAFPQIVSGIYSGTAMLNRLLERKGRKVGCIVSGGLEDYFKLERGIQTYPSFSYSDRLHVATHFHNEPLVPRERMKGVRGRVDVFGEEVLPLSEDDAHRAARELRVAAIVREEIAAHGSNGDTPFGAQGGPPLFLSSELYPQRRDLPRL